MDWLFWLVFFVIVIACVGLCKYLRDLLKDGLAAPAQPNHFADTSGGVWIKEPNGSSHPIQNIVEQQLCSSGVAVYDIRKAAAETLLRSGEWTAEIAANSLSFAVVGRIITTKTGKTSRISRTVRSIHSPTGKRFNDLPEDHPDYREPNSCYRDSVNLPLGFKAVFYTEPKDEFRVRSDKEAQEVPLDISEYALDVRFYGQGGRILGACVAKVDDSSEEPLKELAEQLLQHLAESLKPSLNAHERKGAFDELSRYQPTLVDTSDPENLHGQA